MPAVLIISKKRQSCLVQLKRKGKIMNLPNITIVDKYKVRIDAFECKKCGKVPATTIDLRPYAGQYVRIWLDEDGTYALDPRRNHFWQMAEFQVPEQEYKQVDSGDKDPETKEPIMVPEADFEREGFVPDVVFPTGLIDRGDRLQVYYGAADTNVGVVEWSKAELLAALR